MPNLIDPAPYSAYVLNWERRVMAAFATRSEAADFAKASNTMMVLCVAKAGYAPRTFIPMSERILELELPHGPMGSDFRSWGRRAMPT